MLIVMMLLCASMLLALLLQFRSYRHSPRALPAGTSLAEKWGALQTLFETETTPGPETDSHEHPAADAPGSIRSSA